QREPDGYTQDEESEESAEEGNRGHAWGECRGHHREMPPASTRKLATNASPRKRTQVAPASGQAMKMKVIGKSASSEVWSQPKRTNSIPHQTNTRANTSTKRL